MPLKLINKVIDRRLQLIIQLAVLCYHEAMLVVVEEGQGRSSEVKICNEGDR